MEKPQRVQFDLKLKSPTCTLKKGFWLTERIIHLICASMKQNAQMRSIKLVFVLIHGVETCKDWQIDLHCQRTWEQIMDYVYSLIFINIHLYHLQQSHNVGHIVQMSKRDVMVKCHRCKQIKEFGSCKAKRNPLAPCHTVFYLENTRIAHDNVDFA